MSDAEKTQNLQKMKVPELKKLLKDKGLATTGNKSELIDRLQNTESEELGDATLEDDILDGDEEEDDVPEDEGGEDDLTEDDLLTEKENTEISPNTLSDKIEDTSATEHKIVKIGTKTEPERLASRAERFGVVSEEGKKNSRAERFGISTSDGSTGNKSSKAAPLSTESTLDAEKLKQRAERFGGSVSSSLTKIENVDRMKKRAERFGQVTAPQLSKVESQEKIEKRKERFGAITSGTGDSSSTTGEQAKKKLRAERFGLGK